MEWYVCEKKNSIVASNSVYTVLKLTKVLVIQYSHLCLPFSNLCLHRLYILVCVEMYR